MAILIATGLLSAVVARTLSLDDDPVRSLADPDPAVAALFERFQERSPFRGRIFVETGALPAADREALEARLGDAGYVEEALFQAPSPDATPRAGMGWPFFTFHASREASRRRSNGNGTRDSGTACGGARRSDGGSDSKSSSAIASSTRNSPILVRRRLSRCAPQPSLSPISCAIDRM
jgi:hypothetical protein